MKTALTILLILHGLIHSMGFIKAFWLTKIDQLTLHISKPMGLLWLLTAILLVITAIVNILGKEYWPAAAIIGAALSQLLIVLFWKDAKFGTIANVIILMVSLPAYGHFRFRNMVTTEVVGLFEKSTPENPHNSSQKTIEDLPAIVQKWILNSGSTQRPRITSVRLKQKGEMKTKTDGKWMSFSAQQYFNIQNAAFLWITKVNAMPFIYMDGRDKLNNGQGEMLIKLLSLFPVVEEGKNEKINSASMQRYLAEMCWFPSGATEDYISWAALDTNSAKATMTISGKEVSGIFTFSEEGDFVSFETQRYFGGESNAALETWFIQATDHKSFEGIRVPNKCKVTWKLKDGDFNWLNLEIIDLEYDCIEIW